jgi:neuronal growth regulator 1
MHFLSLSFKGGSIYNGNVMKIHSVSKEDRGTYYCFADNGVGKGDRRNVNLEVSLQKFISGNRLTLAQLFFRLNFHL